jgi:hypothetical protein
MVPDNRRRPRKQSTEQLWNLTKYGVLAQFLGGFVLGLASSSDGSDPPLALVIASWAIIGIGSAVLFVGLVGWGVLLALRARAKEAA